MIAALAGTAIPRGATAHRSCTLLDIHPEPDGLLLSLECENRDRLTVRIELDESGLGRRATVFAT